MKLVKTEDNSYTFYSEEYQQWYHSKSGAMEEAQKKFIEPLEVTDGMTILDICFGLGYNTYTAIIRAKNLKIICLEKDLKVLVALQGLEMGDKFDIIKKLAKELKYKDEDYDLKLLVGDARDTIKQVKDKVDVVFLDPFSPKMNPELWTAEFFKDIYKIMKPNTKLATYSCARVVRDNLREAGFVVQDGIKLHRRGPSTIAIKT